MTPCTNFKSRFTLVSAAMLYLFILGLSGCGAGEKEPQTVVNVQVAPATRGPIEQTVSAEAVVYPLEQAVITPKITATVRKFHVQRGSRVKRGQLLAELENQDLAGAAEQSKGAFEQAEASYAMTAGASLPEQIQKAELDATAAKAAFDAQQKIYDARKALFEEGALPRRDLETAEVQLAQARSLSEQAQRQLTDLNRLGKQETLKSAGGQLSSAKGNYLAAKAQLSYSEIRSPIDGFVTDRPLYEGELAAASQPILTVMDTSKLIAKAHIVQNEAVLLKVGDQAAIAIPGLAQPIKGQVMLVSPALDPGSTTIEVWFEALHPGPHLKPGMNVSIEAVAKHVKDALLVPVSAIFFSPEAGDYVLVAGPDNKAHLTPVKVGIRTNEFAEITSPLTEKAPIITAGGYGVPDGTNIIIEAVPPAGEKPDAGHKDEAAAPSRDKE